MEEDYKIIAIDVIKFANRRKMEIPKDDRDCDPFFILELNLVNEIVTILEKNRIYTTYSRPLSQIGTFEMYLLKSKKGDWKIFFHLDRHKFQIAFTNVPVKVQNLVKSLYTDEEFTED